MRPSLPDQGYRVRPPLVTEIEAVLALLVARDIADIGAPDIVPGGLREEWRSADFDLCTDARVVEAPDGRIVGYAAMSHPGMLVVVGPDQAGRGFGSRLRRWAEQRDRARGSARHRQWIAASNASARALLLAAGYRPERSYWRLGRKLDGLDAEAPPPVGITIRPVDVDEDAAALHAVNEVSFKFVDLLGVHPDHRTQGLGTAMLRAAFARFAAAGLREAELGVASDNPNALRLYERVGMTPRFRYDTYERALRS